MPASRRDQILSTAADLFAERGFHGTSVADLGAACGMSGPALYKHFPSKDALLAAMLVSISEELLAVGTRRTEEADDPATALDALIDWHISFALANKSLIVVQDRDWAALPVEARERVRTLQRKYVALWAAQLRALSPGLDDTEAHVRAHATFGLLNSTPHSAFLPEDGMRAVLHDMAARALGLTDLELTEESA